MSNFKSLLVAMTCGLLVAGSASAQQPKPELLLPLGHTDDIESVAFSPDGLLVLTGSADGTARLWDISSGKSVAVFAGHDQAVHAVAFARHGKAILTGSCDGTAKLWEVTTRKALAGEELKARLIEQGYDLWTGTPKLLSDRAARDLALWSSVTKGIQIQ